MTANLPASTPRSTSSHPRDDLNTEESPVTTLNHPDRPRNTPKTTSSRPRPHLVPRPGTTSTATSSLVPLPYGGTRSPRRPKTPPNTPHLVPPSGTTSNHTSRTASR